MSDKRHPRHPIFVETLFGGFDSWDSEYFMYIAEHGYEHDICLAFFPLYPMLMRFIASILSLMPVVGVAPFRSLVLISGVAISNVSFVVSAFLLYHLTIKVFASKSMAYVTVFLYAVNPASVFMSTVYTESSFACACFAGMLALTHSQAHLACLAFAVAVGLRSNGLVTIGFILYRQGVSMLLKILRRQLSLPGTLQHVVETITQCTIIALPFALFQFYAYRTFCFNPSSQTELPSFCHQLLPLSYTYVQKKYWDVGFLRYYQLKQIPNFLLALPVVVLAVYALRRYFRDLFRWLHGKENIYTCLASR